MVLKNVSNPAKGWIIIWLCLGGGHGQLCKKEKQWKKKNLPNKKVEGNVQVVRPPKCKRKLSEKNGNYTSQGQRWFIFQVGGGWHSPYTNKENKNFKVKFKAWNSQEFCYFWPISIKIYVTTLKNQILVWKKVEPKHNLSKIKLAVFWIEGCVPWITI